MAGRADAPPPTEPEPATTLDLVELAAADPLEVSAVAAGHHSDLFVDDCLGLFAVHDGRHRNLGIARRADLAHKDKIDGCLECPGDLHRQGDASARQSVDNGIGKIERLEPRSELSPGIGAIDKAGLRSDHGCHGGPCSPAHIDLPQCRDHNHHRVPAFDDARLVSESWALPACYADLCARV